MDAVSSVTNFKLVACSYNHSMGVTENGRVYGWGYGWYGATGSSEGTTHRIPTKIKWFEDNNKHVESVTCGYYRSGLIVKDKKT